MASDRLLYRVLRVMQQLRGRRACYFFRKGSYERGYFHRFVEIVDYEYSNVYAVVENLEGEVVMCNPEDVRFITTKKGVRLTADQFTAKYAKPKSKRREG